MKIKAAFVVILTTLLSCGDNRQDKVQDPQQPALVGTWKLIKGVLIEKGDTTVTDYTQKVSFIKIINDTHFAFLQHDLDKGKDSTAVFVAGGGSYSLADSMYTEHLEYCNDRNWENNDFKFTIQIKDDTLIQSGVEKVESAGVNRLNIEQYVRLKK